MADLSDIPDEAVTAAARAFFAGTVDPGEWDDLTPATQKRTANRMRAALAAAFPVLNTARDAETREAIAAELEILSQELQQLANQRAEIDGDDFEDCDDADQADCHTAASVSTYVRAKNLLLRRAASLRGEQL